MKVYVTGTRGIPGIPGGVERHCEQLYPRIAEAHHDMEIALSRRSCYARDAQKDFAGIELRDVYCPRLKSIEAIVHTTLSVLDARLWGADVVHIHSIGPSIITPLARLLGMEVVVTNHGPDYERRKWGVVAKYMLRLGEYLGTKFANEVISISVPIRDHLKSSYSRPSHLIFNGVPRATRRSESSYLRSLGLVPGDYILAVTRLVPEKGLHDLLDAFEGLNISQKLLIAGDSDHEDSYSRSLKSRFASNPRVVSPGYLDEEKLAEVYSHAALFVLPSYHEGLPISLLEALSFGLPVIASDIPANTEVKLSPECYFPVGNIESLQVTLLACLDRNWNNQDRCSNIELVRGKYNWDEIARQTIAVYKGLDTHKSKVST